MKAIIIEDEERAQIYLENVLKQVAPDISIVQKCDDLPSGVIAIKKHLPDVVFLDIEMPKYSGLDIYKFIDLEDMNFKIIFTTAYNQYAIEGYSVAAFDYLLKPINPEKLKLTLDRLKSLENKSQKLEELGQLKSKIAFPDGNQMVLIDHDDIIFLKAENSYTEINLSSGKKITTCRALKSFENNLSDNKNFFRCHRSYIINLNFVSSFVKGNYGFITLKNNHEIPVSSDKVTELLNQFVVINK